MKVIDNISKTFNLSEAGHGVKEVQFAFLNPDTNETITPFCMCKDYFNDMFFTKKTGTSVHIYGFKWNKDDDHGVLDKDQFTIAVRLRDRNNKEKFFDIEEKQIESIFYLLNTFNKSNKFGYLSVYLSDDKKYAIIVFDKKWTEIPYINSAFFLLVRLGFTYNKDEGIIAWYEKGSKNFISPNDESYFKQRKDRIKDLLEGKVDSKQTYDKYTAGSIHNNSGIVGYQGYKID